MYKILYLPTGEYVMPATWKHNGIFSSVEEAEAIIQTRVVYHLDDNNIAIKTEVPFLNSNPILNIQKYDYYVSRYLLEIVEVSDV